MYPSDLHGDSGLLRSIESARRGGLPHTYLVCSAVFQLFQFGMNGLILQIILAVLYQLLQLFHALLGGFHSLPDRKGFITDRGKRSVQLVKSGDTMLRKIIVDAASSANTSGSFLSERSNTSSKDLQGSGTSAAVVFLGRFPTPQAVRQSIL